MSKKEKLAEKITSSEQLLRIYGYESGFSRPSDYLSMQGDLVQGRGRVLSAAGDNFYGTQSWWAIRESLRISEGVYEMSDVLKNINYHLGIGQHIVHVSREDRTMIAYTASREDGERDKQTRTTLGRFLHKFCIHYTDDQIQKLEQAHKAEVCASIAWATDADEIGEVYMNMAGDSGCMRHEPSYFGIQDGTHPSAVYAAPGFAVAYIKTDEGDIKARAVTWTNPDDASDKRYIRIYGNPVLKRLLTNEGYRVGNLVGAKLPKIQLVSDQFDEDDLEHRYVVPYLDGPDGNQSETLCVVDEGDGFLTVVDGNRRGAIQRAVGEVYVPSAKSTSGYLYVPALPASDFVSALTGKTYSIYKTPPTLWYDEATDTVGKVARDELLGVQYKSLRTYFEEKVQVVQTLTTTREFIYSGPVWADNTVNRQHCGHIKLSEKYYPDNRDWQIGGTLSCHIDGETHVLFKADTICILPADMEAVTYRHVSDETALRKAGYINASPVGGTTTLIDRARSTLRRTQGGTVFCKKVHGDKFVELVDGTWIATSQAEHIRWSSKSVFVAKGGANPYDKLTPEMFVDAVRETMYGKKLVTIGGNVNADGMDLSTLDVVINTLTTTAGTIINHQVGFSYTVVDGKATDISWNSQTMADYTKVLNAIENSAHGTDKTMTRMRVIGGAVRILLNQYLTPLLTLRSQLEAEAAGQLRIDAVTVDEIDAALAAPTAPADGASVAEVVPVAPVAVDVPAVSDERFALAA